MAEGAASQASSPADQFVSEAKSAVAAAVAAEHPLLYDSTGRPIPQDSELWRSAEHEWRLKATQVVEELLDQIPTEKLPKSEGELKETLTKALHANPKPEYVFTPHDGKLTIPLSLQVGKLQIQGALPLYKIAAGIVAGVGISKLAEKPTPPTTPGTERVNPEDGQECSMDAYRERVLTEERDRLCDELQFAWMVGIEMAEASPEGKAERLCAALRVAAVSRNLKYWDASIGWGIQKQACNALKRLASESSVLRFQIARAILDIPALSRKPAHEYTIGSATLRVRENAYDEGAEGALCWAMELYAEMLQDPVQIHHQDDILEDLKVMLRYDTGHGVDHTGQLDVEMTAARVLQDFAAQDSQRMFEFGKEGLRGAWRDTIHWGIDMIAGSRHPDACALLGWVEFAPEFDDGTHEKARKARQSLVLGRVDL